MEVIKKIIPIAVFALLLINATAFLPSAPHDNVKTKDPMPVSGFALKDLLSLATIAKHSDDKRIVYIGETHTRYGDHLMQLEMIKQLHRRNKDLAIGMEMFEHRYQKALDDYLAGHINERDFLKQSRYFSTWGFNYFLYQDIIAYARTNKIPLIALNQDHELVAKVARVGLDGLTQRELALIPKGMDFGDKAYENRLRHSFQIHEVELPHGEAPAVFEFFYQAQLVWDESMARSVDDFLNLRPDHHLVVLAGAGHLAFGSGIPKRVYRRKQKDYVIILPAREGELASGIADFVVFTSDAETKEPPELGVILESDQERLMIKSVLPGTGAEKAGMRKGDVILEADHDVLKDIDSLKAMLMTKHAGDSVPVTVKRGGKMMKMRVKL